MKKLILLLLSLASLVGGGFAQDTTQHALQILGRAQKDQITLRWAPNSPRLWEVANQYGMKLGRYTIIRDGKALTQPELKEYPDLFKPLPLEAWEALSQNDDYALVAAQAIYGESFEVTENMSSDISRAINQTKELEQRHLFALFAADQSKTVALGSGLLYEDKDVKENEKYLYTISCPVPKETLEVDTGFIFIGLEDYFPLPRPEGIVVEIAEGNALISWEARRFADFFNSYIVERSDDGGKTFQSITETPIVTPLNEQGQVPEFIFKGDTLGELNKEYFYRVKGINPFGEISEASDTVSITDFPRLGAQPRIYNAIGRDDGGLEVLWDFPSEERANIKGFRLDRASSINGTYETIVDNIPNTDSSVTDPAPLASNYYILKAFDEFGTEGKSMPYLGMVEDSIPPAIPLGLTGEIDTTGLITLRWNKNTELDLLGYRVYTSNFASEEYIQITHETHFDTVFTHQVQLNTLNRDIFFKLTAIDGHFNPSDFSETIIIKRPDIIPPTPPQFTSIKNTEKGIALNWTPSPSEDVVQTTLYRKSKEDMGWRPLHQASKGKGFIDAEVSPHVQYAYILIAKDEAGNESTPSKAVSIVTNKNLEVTAISQAKARANYEEKSISLSWKFEQPDVQKFLIYRSMAGGKLSLLKEINGKERAFQDPDVRENTKYAYRIQASMTNGALSEFSKALTVKY